MTSNTLKFIDKFREVKNLEIIESQSDIKRLSKDFYNYSPILTEILDECIADLVVRPSDHKAIEALQLISKKYSSIQFENLDSLHAYGGVFLKANQKTSNVFVRSENGLGEGILITCQYDSNANESNTFGPLPLDFFHN